MLNFGSEKDLVAVGAEVHIATLRSEVSGAGLPSRGQTGRWGWTDQEMPFPRRGLHG